MQPIKSKGAMRAVFYFVLFLREYVENDNTSQSVTAAGPGYFVPTHIYACVYLNVSDVYMLNCGVHRRQIPPSYHLH